MTPRDDVLRSGGDGSYCIGFFAASVAHDINTSRRVFSEMAGNKLSEQRPQWDGLSRSGKLAHQLETHEMAHHGLIFATPCGGLIWRLNQVISRDCGFLMRNCNEMGIEFKGLRSPRTCFASEEWREKFLRDVTTEDEAKRRAYCLAVSEALSRLERFLDILTGKTVDMTITVGEFINLANFVYSYLEDRCERPFVTTWKTRLPLSALLHAGAEYTFNDIAEVQAICAELFTLRALKDVSAFQARAADALQGPYGIAVGLAQRCAATNDPFGFSPYFPQMMSLSALSGAIDVIPPDTPRERYIEDEFPWFRFKAWENAQGAMITTAVTNLIEWAHQPLIGTGSKWLYFVDWTKLEGFERANALISTVASFGLDLQVYLMHQGAMLNMRYLMGQLIAATPPGADKPPIEPLQPGDWANETRFLIQLIEYDDGLLFLGVDVDEVYKPDHPIRTMGELFKFLCSPEVRVMANIVVGTTVRHSYASFAWRQVPSLDILRPKLAKLFERDSVAESICEFLKLVYEHSLDPALLVHTGRYI